jgi:hypothetical protein
MSNCQPLRGHDPILWNRDRVPQIEIAVHLRNTRSAASVGLAFSPSELSELLMLSEFL